MNSSPYRKGRDRYQRQKRLLGKANQETLGNSSAAIIGAGGLGSPAATYLAMAGIGRLVLVDHDQVAPSNLNRQFLHQEKDLDRPKPISAREKLKALNPDTAVETFEGKLTSDNLENLPDVDLLIGSVDNFETRYLLNQQAVNRNIPYIHGAVEGFSGQLTTIVPGNTPRLRCIFPKAPPDKTGIQIMGTTAGVVGTMMANEAIKYLTNHGSLATGELLLIDIACNNFDRLEVQKSPDCPVCGN